MCGFELIIACPEIIIQICEYNTDKYDYDEELSNVKTNKYL